MVMVMVKVEWRDRNKNRPRQNLALTKLHTVQRLSSLTVLNPLDIFHGKNSNASRVDVKQLVDSRVGVINASFSSRNVPTVPLGASPELATTIRSSSTNFLFLYTNLLPFAVSHAV